MSSGLWYVRDRDRVTGPFSREQLEAMRRRGQLSRFHQVSQDKQTWVNATIFAGLFGPQYSGAGAPALPESAPGWYYAIDGSPSGPVSADELVGLLRARVINSDTLVWNERLPSWVTLRDSGLALGVGFPAGDAAPQAPSSRRGSARTFAKRGMLIVSVVTAIAIGVISATLATAFRGTWAGPGSHKQGAATIRSPLDGPELASAVGLVVCGGIVTEFDGTQTEVPFSTGSCFVVSSNGLLLTNRHVIEDISRLLNADELREELARKKKLKIDPKIWIFFKDQKYLATIEYKSDDFDFAVLKIQPTRPLPRFRLAASAEVPRGTPVFALGFPGASRVALSEREELEKLVREAAKGVRVERHFQKSSFDYVVTNGIVSVIRIDGSTARIEHTARLSAGNSGGPLVTSDGTVVGINTLMAKENLLAVPTYLAVSASQVREELAHKAAALLAP